MGGHFAHHEKNYRGFIVRVVCRVFTEKILLYGRSVVVGLKLRGSPLIRAIFLPKNLLSRLFAN